MTNPIVISDIFPPNYSVTGIRSENANNTQVIMTGSCPVNTQNPKPVQALLYRGPMDGSGQFFPMIPPMTGGKVQSSVFYGPNTHYYNPKLIAERQVRAVGTYNYGTNPLIDNHGMMYEGPLPQNSNESTWTLIDMPADRVGGGNVINTIPHSTMGNLVVGNYERVYIERGNEVHEVGAFIYDINNPGEHQYRELRLEPYKLITAYGIWQNGNDTTSYTIAGGMLDASGFNVGFLVDYNSETRNTNNLRPFVYDNMNRNFITHFEGITNLEIGTPESAPRYHSLAATGDENLKNGGAAFAVVERLLPSGVFGDAKWQPFQVGNSFTTGNTVLTNNLFGVYETANSTSKGIQSYWVGDL